MDCGGLKPSDNTAQRPETYPQDLIDQNRNTTKSTDYAAADEIPVPQPHSPPVDFADKGPGTDCVKKRGRFQSHVPPPDPGYRPVDSCRQTGHPA